MKNQALALLQEMTGNPAAEFHDDQFQAISQLVEYQAKLLVVQKTGWGKSAVYFIATKLLRIQGKGPTIIISPLIALMRNQIERAGQLGLRVVSINSSQSQEANDFAKQQIINQSVDAVIISPEQLANDEMIENVLSHVMSNIGLFVVDEAHCISDWGHDFRPDYRRIVRVLNFMPTNMPVLATTATANSRVITDINEQLGKDLKTIRGDLKRNSLYLQNIPTSSRVERMAWLVEVIPQLEGSGIVYVKTVRDCDLLADWLNHNGIKSAGYHGGTKSENEIFKDEERIRLEQALLSNSIKVLVATSALGMGFDKPDLGFVIHFQLPGSIVEYYQQVGRAGRGIAHAYGMLMNGAESQAIQSYFIQNAFPKEDEIEQVLDAIEKNGGLKLSEIEPRTNLRSSRIQAILKFLSVESPSPIYKDGQNRYLRNELDYSLPYDRITRVSQMKEHEWKQLTDYHQAKYCLMKELTSALDDPLAESCGNCANCLPSLKISIDFKRERVLAAADFVKMRYVPIKPRKQFGTSKSTTNEAFPIYKFPRKSEELQMEVGLALSRWKDGVWGDIVADGKKQGRFSDELLAPMLKMIQSMQFKQRPEWLAYVPSLRHPQLVKDFAYRLAAVLGIPCKDAIVIATARPPQKTMQNSFKQSQNLDGVFEIDTKQGLAGSILLLDDAVDSGWTLAVTTALLRRSGVKAVYPIALTSTAQQDQGE